MNRATRSAAAAILLAALTLAGTAWSQVRIEPIRGSCAGRLDLDAGTGAVRFSRVDDVATLRVVYNSFTAPMNFGIYGADNTQAWGDSVLLEKPGTLDQVIFSLYNSLGSGSSLDSASLAVQIEDAAANTLRGSWTVQASFGSFGGLHSGDYVLVAVNDLAVQGVSVGGWLVVKQRVLRAPGFPGAGLGVVSLSPPGVGSSPASMYSSVDGFISIPGYSLDPGYRLVVDAAAPAAPVSWTRVKRLYR